MNDPRYAEPRCDAGMLEGNDMLRRASWRCEFRAGHSGLHFADTAADIPEGFDRSQGKVLRWGTEEQLRAEPLDKLLPPLDEARLQDQRNLGALQALHHAADHLEADYGETIGKVAAAVLRAQAGRIHIARREDA